MYKWDDQPFLNLYSALLKGETAEEPVVMHNDVNSRYHDGTISYDSLAKRMVLRGDRGQEPVRTFRDGGEPRARPLDLLGECRLRARQRVVADERPIGDRREDIGLQHVRRDRRFQLQRRLRKRRRAFFVTAERIFECDAHEPDDAGARRRLRDVARVEKSN